MLIYPLYNLFFARHGLSAGDISLVLVVWSVTAFVLEIPTGVLADRWSRRHLLAVAQLVRAAAFLVWWLAPGFAGFALGFVLWGAESAMTSGAFEALVFDELEAEGHADRYARVMGTGEAWSSAGAVLGSLIAAAVIPLGFDPVLGASALACVVTGVVALSFPPARPAVRVDGRHYLETLREGVRAVVAHRSLLVFVVFAGIIVGLGAIEEFYGLVLRDAQLDRSSISLWHAAFFLVGIGGNLLAHRMTGASVLRLAGLAVTMGAALAMVSQVPNGIVPLTLLAFQGVYSLQYVALDARLQAMITSRARATVTSVQGFVTELAAIVTFVGFGAVAGGSSTRTAASVAGLVLVVVAAAFAVTITGGRGRRRRGRGRRRASTRSRSRFALTLPTCGP